MKPIRIETNNSSDTRNWNIFIDDKEITALIKAGGLSIELAGNIPVVTLTLIGIAQINMRDVKESGNDDKTN